MFNDNENDNENFDSIPNISFDHNGQPGHGPGPGHGFGKDGFPSFGGDNTHNGQFVPPMALQLNEDQNGNNNDMDTFINITGNAKNNEDDGDDEATFNSEGLNVFSCGDCNAVFGVNGGAAKSCIFCHGNNVLPAQSFNMDIGGVVPFKVSRSKAIQDYKSKVMLNPVIPFAFKSKKIINSIKKTYIPGYLYDTVTSGDVNLLGVDNGSEGKMKFDVSYNTSVEHNNVFYKSTSKINERVFNAVGDYTFTDITSFDVNNIGHCYLLSNDMNKEDINTKMEDNCKKHVLAMTRKNVKHQMKKIQDNSLSTRINNLSGVLVPVYFLNVKYQNKDYVYIMNGENGKSSLEVTSGILEMIIFGVIIALLVFGLSVLASMLF